MKELKDMTLLELLKEFNRIVCNYDSRNADERNFLEEHLNRDFCDDEMYVKYENICNDIESLYNEIRKVSDFINTL